MQAHHALKSMPDLQITTGQGAIQQGVITDSGDHGRIPTSISCELAVSKSQLSIHSKPTDESFSRTGYSLERGHTVCDVPFDLSNSIDSSVHTNVKMATADVASSSYFSLPSSGKAIPRPSEDFLGMVPNNDHVKGQGHPKRLPTTHVPNNPSGSSKGMKRIVLSTKSTFAPKISIPTAIKAVHPITSLSQSVRKRKFQSHDNWMRQIEMVKNAEIPGLESFASISQVSQKEIQNLRLHPSGKWSSLGNEAIVKLVINSRLKKRAKTKYDLFMRLQKNKSPGVATKRFSVRKIVKFRDQGQRYEIETDDIGMKPIIAQLAFWDHTKMEFEKFQQEIESTHGQLSLGKCPGQSPISPQASMEQFQRPKQISKTKYEQTMDNEANVASRVSSHYNQQCRQIAQDQNNYARFMDDNKRHLERVDTRLRGSQTNIITTLSLLGAGTKLNAAQRLSLPSMTSMKVTDNPVQMFNNLALFTGVGDTTLAQMIGTENNNELLRTTGDATLSHMISLDKNEMPVPSASLNLEISLDEDWLGDALAKAVTN